jgi:integrase/recombinase XerD
MTTEITIRENANDVQVFTKKEKEEVPIYYTDEELNQFFRAIPENKMRDKVFFLTLLGSGRRLSEILSIKKGDIDLTTRTLKIKTLKRRKLKIDTIRLHQDLAYWISIYVGGYKNVDLIFPFSRQYADELCKLYAKEAGITHKRASCHIFRHTFAVRWLEQGKPIHKLKRHLGHSNIMTTMVYLQICDTDYNDTVDSLNIMGFNQ